MLFSPTLAVSRLVVEREGVDVFHHLLPPGLSVFGGENGSGKTTIADFIFYALGGEPTSWRDAALRCDRVTAAVELNGEPVVLERAIDTSARRPLRLFFGTYERSRNATPSEWQEYPYAAQSQKESFSQLLFDLLKMPEVRLESSRVTMHQVLRLLYVDQATPATELFVGQTFDKFDMRQAVGDLLLGIYDHHLYDAKERKRACELEAQVLRTHLKNVYSLLAGTESVPTLDYVDAELGTLRERRVALYAALESISSGGSVGDGAEHVATIETELRRANAARSEVDDAIQGMRVDLADSELFANALRVRLEAITEGDATREGLGAIEFTVCPACNAPLEERGAGVCPVCGRRWGGDSEAPNRLRLRNALAQQLRESEMRQEELRAELRKAEERRPGLLEQQKALQLRYEEFRRPRTAATAALEQTHRDIGYLERQIEDLVRRRELAERLDALTKRREELGAEIARLSEDIEMRLANQEKRLAEATTLVSEITTSILRRDLPREAEFGDPKSVTFDFAANSVKVDGRSNFAASSMVFLKNAFHLALLIASTKLKYMRLPRFMFFDNVEDKGMEPERSHRFQEIVAEESAAIGVDHQIVMFTSMLSPTLAAFPGVVVDRYTHERKSIVFGGSSVGGEKPGD